MAALSSKLRSVRIENSRDGFAHYCPGCKSTHIIYTKGSGTIWSWDGNVDAPTVTPSVRIFIGNKTLCHYYLKGGKIDFLGDCAHELKSQSVDLPDWPYKPGEYGGVKD